MTAIGIIVGFITIVIAIYGLAVFFGMIISAIVSIIEVIFK